MRGDILPRGWDGRDRKRGPQGRRTQGQGGGLPSPGQSLV